MSITRLVSVTLAVIALIVAVFGLYAAFTLHAAAIGFIAIIIAIIICSFTLIHNILFAT